jgi:hypothetical protein
MDIAYSTCVNSVHSVSRLCNYILKKSLKVTIKTTVRAWETKQILHVYSSPDYCVLTSVETVIKNGWNSAVD